jgi:hypothetical protein
MAQAQVTITAVDRTQAAINSAMRSMKTLERTAKVTAKAVNFAFGFFTGSLIISAFGKITKAAEKTEEGQRALLELNRALKDPALIAAAEGITNALVKGFAGAIGQAAKFIKFIRSEMVSLGLIGPSGSAADAASIIRGQISSRRSGLVGLRPGQADIAQGINTEIAALRIQLGLVEGLAAAEAKRQEQRIDAEIKAENSVKSTKKLKDESQKLFEEQARKMAELQSFYDELRKAPEMLEVNFSAADVTIANSVQNILDEMNRADQIMANFAQSAAQNIQSAFAEFLFDPFKGGLKGMLSSFLDVTRRMLAELAAQQILGAIFGSFAGGTGFMASFAKAITGRASGGPVSKNTPYIVGERGPELFVPGSSGGIVPNHAMMGGGMTVAPVYNIDARGATADLQSALPGILQENNRRIFEELDRRYGVGR